MDSLLFWLWLSLRCTVGSETFSKLQKTFSKPSDVYRADRATLEEALYPYKKDLKALCNKDLSDVRRVMDYCLHQNIKIMTYESPDYPNAFREISSPPLVLYYYGEIPNLSDNLVVSVVGTRKMTEYGKKLAFEISGDLATAGAVIVSGMALGVDGTAHAAAINGGGKTVAILGSGIDRIYPPTHKRLYSYIIKNGAVITEFPPHEPPERYNFPKRNRLISAISQATVVIEGDEISGALITGREAMKQWRVVYAVPGKIDEPTGSGTAILLKEGAKCITCADDILNDFSVDYNGRINIFKLLKKTKINIEAVLLKMGVDSKTIEPKKSSSSPHANEHSNKAEAKNSIEDEINSIEESAFIAERQKVLESLGKEAIEFYERIPKNEEVYIEAIAEKGKITEALSATTLLEIYGLIESLPGGRIRRKK